MKSHEKAYGVVPYLLVNYFVSLLLVKINGDV